MRAGRRKHVFALFGVPVAAWLLVGCGSGAYTRTERINSVFIAPGQPHTLHVYVDTEGTCPGNEQKPRVQSLAIEELAGRNVLITASVHYFPRTGSGCAGIGLVLEHTVHTHRPARSLAYYDGSESAPRHLDKKLMSRREFDWLFRARPDSHR